MNTYSVGAIDGKNIIVLAPKILGLCTTTTGELFQLFYLQYVMHTIGMHVLQEIMTA